MGNTLAEIRARLAAAENKTFTNDNTIFPFWNAKNDSTSVIRFLRDGDPTNTFFWVEKQQIRLPFNGIKGGESKPVTVSVPCVEMFGKAAYPQGCPILAQVRAWYKDPSLTEQANKYWKKPVYIFQGFVRDNAVPEDKAPENPIRRFHLNKQLFNLAKAGLMDVEMENIPCDDDHGTDFRITKTQKGQYADYGTSSYARRESALTQAELDAIEKYKLVNLSELLGKKPTEHELEIIKEMFEASVDGEEYDISRWGQFYRPAGVKIDEDKTTTRSTPVATPVTKPAAEPETTVAEPVATETPVEPAPEKHKLTSAEILAGIRARQQSK
jgi:hypothetical protein